MSKDLGVIRPVHEATEWCAGMVVVPKADGKICIGVDFTKLNESVCRELHTHVALCGANISAA